MDVDVEKKEPQIEPVAKAKANAVNPLALYRWYNAAVGTLVLLRYMTNPDAAASEYLTDAFIHFFEAAAPNSLTNLALAANALRGAQAGYGFFSGDSTIPQALNFLDIGNHAINIAHRL